MKILIAGFQHETNTFAPSEANSLAVSAPMPLVPPVINATFPFNLSDIILTLYLSKHLYVSLINATDLPSAAKLFFI